MSSRDLVLLLLSAQLLLTALLLGALGYLYWWLRSLRRIFVSGGDGPMDPKDFSRYQQILEMAARAADACGISRLIQVETAPGVHRSLIDVSSRGQVTLLLEHMARHGHPDPAERIVIDLGANDGFQGSHSFNLTQIGWWAVLVEPNPEVLPVLGRIAAEPTRWQGAEERVIVVPAAVTESGDDGPRTFHVQGWRHTGSSLQERDESPHRYVLEVQAVRVETLMAQVDRTLRSRGLPAGLARTFGVLSLDIEGADLAVLQGVLDLGFRPRYILIEMRESLEQVDALVLALGYQRLSWFHADAIYWRTDPEPPRGDLPE